MSYSIQRLQEFIENAKKAEFYTIKQAYNISCAVRSVLKYVHIEDASLGQLDAIKVQQEFNSITGDKIKYDTKKLYFRTFLSTVKDYINIEDHPEKLIAKIDKKKTGQKKKNQTEESKKTGKQIKSENKTVAKFSKNKTQEPIIGEQLSTEKITVKKPRIPGNLINNKMDQFLAKERPIESDDDKTIIFPVPIRDGVVIEIKGLPINLTENEASKIGRVVKALACDI